MNILCVQKFSICGVVVAEDSPDFLFYCSVYRGSSIKFSFQFELTVGPESWKLSFCLSERLV